MARPWMTMTRLWEWGRWGAVQNLGFPRISSFFGERALKMPSANELTPDIERVERAVCKLEYAERRLLWDKYQWGITLSEMAKTYGYSKSTAKRRLEQAERSVDFELTH